MTITHDCWYTVILPFHNEACLYVVMVFPTKEMEAEVDVRSGVYSWTSVNYSWLFCSATKCLFMKTIDKCMEKCHISTQISHIQASIISTKHFSLLTLVLLVFCSTALCPSQWHSHTVCGDGPLGSAASTSQLRKLSCALQRGPVSPVWAESPWVLEGNPSVCRLLRVPFHPGTGSASPFCKTSFYLFAVLFKQTERNPLRMWC